jgi:hypothetical protein
MTTQKISLAMFAKLAADLFDVQPLRSKELQGITAKRRLRGRVENVIVLQDGDDWMLITADAT